MLTPLTTVPIAEEIAKNRYYNGMNNIIQQTRPSIQETLSQPQLFGYTVQNNVDDRFIQTVQQFATPLPTTSSGFSNRSLQALVEEPKQKPVEQYTAPVTSSPNPGSEHEPLIPNPIISKSIMPQFISSDALVISKSTVIIVISVIVAVLLIEVWLRQKRIELLMLQQQQTHQQQPFQTPQQTVTYQ